MTIPNPHKAEIIRLLHTGMTAGEIAAAIGNGVTRNMVAGYRSRNGGAETFGRMTEPKPQRHLPSLQPSGGTCKWIDTDPKQMNWKFCGKPSVGRERSWCDAHRKRVYMRPTAAPDAGRPLRKE